VNRMDPTEMMEYLSIVPDEIICTFADVESALVKESFERNDRDAMAADLLLSQMIHAELVWRGLDVQALDFFAKVNAIHPVLDGLTYSEYVEFVRDSHR